jgi:hypothetical protein
MATINFTATSYTGFLFLNTNPINFANDRRSQVGIFTALQTPYNPYSKNANMIVGLDYRFNWIRS